MAGSETSVLGSLFNKVASLTSCVHLTVLETEAATGGVLQKNVSKKFHKIHRKRLCRSHFFNKVAGLRSATLFKKETLAHVFFL